jgi:hypothetical protein
VARVEGSQKLRDGEPGLRQVCERHAQGVDPGDDPFGLAGERVAALIAGEALQSLEVEERGRGTAMQSQGEAARLGGRGRIQGALVRDQQEDLRRDRLPQPGEASQSAPWEQEACSRNTRSTGSGSYRGPSTSRSRLPSISAISSLSLAESLGGSARESGTTTSTRRPSVTRKRSEGTASNT